MDRQDITNKLVRVLNLWASDRLPTTTMLNEAMAMLITVRIAHHRETGQRTHLTTRRDVP
jgi:hypothetical protein